VLQTARLCAEAQVLFDEKMQNEWWIIGLLKVVKEVIRIDEAYEEWDESAASGIWGYKKIRSSSLPNHAPQHIYHDVSQLLTDIVPNWGVSGVFCSPDML
jgi:hypothetical protein